jgi:hypothetical protein
MFEVNVTFHRSFTVAPAAAPARTTTPPGPQEGQRSNVVTPGVLALLRFVDRDACTTTNTTITVTNHL